MLCFPIRLAKLIAQKENTSASVAHPSLTLGLGQPAMIRLHELISRISPIVWRRKGSKNTSSAIVDIDNVRAPKNEGAVDSKAAEVPDSARDEQDYHLEKIFTIFDRNKSGFLTLDEFIEVLKCYQIDVSEHKALELFALGDNDCSGLIDADGMRRVISKLQSNIALEVIGKYGKGASKLATVFFGVFVVLLFLVGFILLGIEGFGNKSGFTAVINSILPLVMGGAVDRGGDVDSNDNEDDEASAEALVSKIEEELKLLDID